MQKKRENDNGSIFVYSNHTDIWHIDAIADCTLVPIEKQDTNITPKSLVVALRHFFSVWGLFWIYSFFWSLFHLALWGGAATLMRTITETNG